MKTIFFSEINLLNIFIIVLFKLLRFKVYFIQIDKKLRNISLIRIMEKFGIVWFNYQNYSFKDSNTKISFKVGKLADKYSKEVTEFIWNQNLETYFLEKQNLNICLHRSFMRNFENLCEISAIIKEIGDENEKTYLWAPNHFLSTKVFQENNVKNLCPKYFTYLYCFFICILKFTKLNLIFINKKIFSIFKLHSKNNKQSKENKLNSKIVFFPHCGVIMPYFKKNHYYSDDKTSPFYCSNILHIDWNRKDKRITKETFKFYNEKRITPIYWNELKSDKSKYKFKEIIFFIYLFVALIKKLDLLLVVQLLTILIKIEESKKKLSNFKNLKIVLIGYEQVFPLEIAVACRSKNIKLVANQERPINPTHKNQYILDKYFVFGDESKNFFLQNMIDKKMKIINTGIVRMHYHLKEQKKLKIENEEKFNLKCLIADWHSVKDWYLNGRLHNNLTWKKNLSFYRDVVLLAKKNQDILFLIKGKNYNWVEIPYFSGILKEIKASPNIQIFNDFSNYNEWTTSNCIKNVDFGIILMSLIGDEMLVHGKPIILFKREDHKISSVDYGPNILSHSFEDVVLKIEKIKLDINGYNKSLDLIRKKLFTEFKPKNFHLILQEIYNEKNYNIN